MEDEVDRDVGEDERETAGNSWDKNMEQGNEVNGGDGLQDLQYFPNFYHLLRSLDSGKNKSRALTHLAHKNEFTNGVNNHLNGELQSLRVLLNVASIKNSRLMLLILLCEQNTKK